MSPEDRNKLIELEKKVASLYDVHDVSYIEALARRLRKTLNVPSRLSDLDDVEDTDTATTGEVLKKTATTWQPGTDNTA